MAISSRYGHRAIIGFVTLSLALFLMVNSLFSQHVNASSISGTVIPLSSDPYTNTSSQHRTQVEPDTYSFGSTVVSAFQSGRFYTGGGSSGIGWATSKDAGKTWKTGFLSEITLYSDGSYERASDPAVAYDAAHRTWLIASLGMSKAKGNDILVSRSTDGGLSWEKPIVVAAGQAGDWFDKEWPACDQTRSSPFYGRCYIQWDNRAQQGRILMSVSNDGGLTWQNPRSPESQSFAAVSGQPMVQPGGTVVMPIYGTDRTTKQDGIYSYTSTDGGEHWSIPVLVSPVNYYRQTAHYRGGSLPSAEIDRAGDVYIVWADCQFEANCSADDIVMSSSRDGEQWTPLQRIPLDPIGSGVEHVTAGIGVDRTTEGDGAHLAVTYYYFPQANCTDDTCQLYVGYSSSINNGSSWSERKSLAGPMSLRWLANTTEGYMTGDYLSTSIVHHHAVTVFSLAHMPEGRELDQAMYGACLPIIGRATG